MRPPMADGAQPTAAERALAWSVHLYTALGAPIALAALLAVDAGDVRAAFLWMGLAILVDATDGAMARAARVKQVVPHFDGARLDDVVDYLNYVVVPIYLAVRTDMLPETGALAVAALPLLASAYGFCQTAAKTSDFFFTGFPSYWNVIVFYLHALGTGRTTNAVVLVVLAVLVFVPIGYLYPSRQPFLRPLTIVLGVVWGVATAWAVLQLPHPSPLLLGVSLAYVAYYLAVSLYLDVGRRAAARRAS